MLKKNKREALSRARRARAPGQSPRPEGTSANPDAAAQLQQAVDWDDEYYIKRAYAPLTDPTTDRAEMNRRLADSYAYLDALDAAVANGTTFDFDALMKQYDFPGIMRKFHDKNMALRRALPPATGG